MKKILFVLAVIVSCQSIKHPSGYYSKDGAWCLVQRGGMDDVNYARIHFYNNGIITLTSSADTFYSYKYRIEKDTLLIIRYAESDTVRSRILKFTADSLILSSLIEKPLPQRYYRCKK